MPGKKVLVSTASGQRPSSGEEGGGEEEREERRDAHKKVGELDQLGVAGEYGKGKSESCHLHGLSKLYKG